MMNKLALSALCLGALFQTNCVVEGEGSFDVSWELTPGCPAGASIEINAAQVGANTPFVDIYSCSDVGAGFATRLPLGDYNVWVNVVDASGGLFAQSELIPASIDFDGDLIQIDLPTFSVNDGFFGFTWTVNDGAGPTTCDDVFADTVSIEATMVNSTSAIRVGLFTCADGQAVTDPLAVGEYEIFMDILQGQDLLGSSIKRTEIIEWGNQLKDIGNFDFLFQ
ncbi:MAG: hypothetical protein JKY56_16345 [Kofleriaceae bacterium]|nr:hypothetical protein [Kofleriaceae bacterium]